MMKELLNMSIEELEHILAIAPYSEIHQMAWALKKNELAQGAMHQVEEGTFFKMFKHQEDIAKQVIQSKGSEAETATQDDEIETREPKPTKKKKKSKKKKHKILSTKKKHKQKKSPKPVPSEDVEAPQEIPLRKKKKSKKGVDRKKKKSQKIESSSGLSAFSTWLLSRSGTTEMGLPLQSKKKKPKKKPKNKKKLKKDKGVVSEPLADLLASQGHTQLAIDMYQQLGLIFPEKSAFFAAKIEKIQNKK